MGLEEVGYKIGRIKQKSKIRRKFEVFLRRRKQVLKNSSIGFGPVSDVMDTKRCVVLVKVLLKVS